MDDAVRAQTINLTVIMGIKGVHIRTALTATAGWNIMSHISSIYEVRNGKSILRQRQTKNRLFNLFIR